MQIVIYYLILLYYASITSTIKNLVSEKIVKKKT